MPSMQDYVHAYGECGNFKFENSDLPNSYLQKAFGKLKLTLI